MHMFRIAVIDLHVDAFFTCVASQKFGSFRGGRFHEHRFAIECCPDKMQPTAGVGVDRHKWESFPLRMALYHKSKTVENGFGTGAVILLTWLKRGANESANDGLSRQIIPQPPPVADLFCVIGIICGFLVTCIKMCLQSLKLTHRMRAASDFNQHSGFDLSEFRGVSPGRPVFPPRVEIIPTYSMGVEKHGRTISL